MSRSLFTVRRVRRKSSSLHLSKIRRFGSGDSDALMILLITYGSLSALLWVFYLVLEYHSSTRKRWWEYMLQSLGVLLFSPAVISCVLIIEAFKILVNMFRNADRVTETNENRHGRRSAVSPSTLLSNRNSFRLQPVGHPTEPAGVSLPGQFASP